MFKIVRQVLERTFEDFAFMFIDPVPARQVLDSSADTYVLAQINFTTSQETGRLCAVASLDFCQCLSRNILGMEPEETLEPGTAESGLSELVNVACGSLTEALYGVEQAVDLEPPECIQCTRDTWKKIMASEDALALLVDDYPVGFQLILSPAAEPQKA